MKVKFLYVISLSLFFLLISFSLSNAANVCTDQSITTGCPTCTCPQSGWRVITESVAAGSIQLKVNYLGNDVSSLFSPVVKSIKPASDWFYGPYDSEVTLNSCPKTNFIGFAGPKNFVCQSDKTQEQCAYASGAGTGAILLNCVNGPFDGTITYPTGYYPISGPSNAQGTSTEAKNINICGQISKIIEWEVGYLNPPANPKCISTAPTEIRIDFDKVEGATGYEVYRDGSLITTVTTNTFTNKALKLDTEYKYKIKAIRVDKGQRYESGFSTETTCKTSSTCAAPSIPAGVTGNALSSSSIQLSWNASSGQVDGYNVLRYNPSTTKWDKISGNDPIALTTYTDNDSSLLSCGKNISYKIESVGCGTVSTSAQKDVLTLACPKAAGCNGIIGPDSVGLNSNTPYTVDSYGDPTLTYLWTISPLIGGLVSPTNKTASYRGPAAVPAGGKVTLSAKVMNGLNPSGFACTKEITIAPTLGNVDATVKKVATCTPSAIKSPLANFNVTLISKTSSYIADTKTDIGGSVLFRPPISGSSNYTIQIPVARLNSFSLEACPAMSNGWTLNGDYYERNFNLAVGSKESESIPPFYVTSLTVIPSFAKWTSISQGNIIIKSGYKASGLASDFFIKNFGTAFINSAQFLLEIGNFGPIDVNKFKAYLFKQYDNNDLRITEIIDVIKNYPNADVKNCDSIDTKTYDVNKGVLKFISNTATKCVVNLDKGSSFIFPKFSVIYIDGDLNISRNIVSDGLDGLVFIVTGNITIDKDVTVINASLMSGGNLEVKSP